MRCCTRCFSPAGKIFSIDTFMLAVSELRGGCLQKIGLYFRFNNFSYADFVYLPYNKSQESEKKYDQQMVFLACMDAFSKKLWVDLIPEGKVNPTTAAASFKRLFRKGLPHFSILRVGKEA